MKTNSLYGRLSKAAFVLGVFLSALFVTVAPARAEDVRSVLKSAGMVTSEDGRVMRDASLSESIREATDPEDCWGCTMTGILLRTADTMGSEAATNIAPRLTPALVTLFALWVTWRLVALAGSIGGSEAGETIKTILFRSMTFIVIVTLLQTGILYSYVWLKLVYPALSGILGLAESFGNKSISIANIGMSSGDCQVDTGGGELGEFANVAVGQMCSMHKAIGVGYGVGDYLTNSAAFGWGVTGFDIDIKQWVIGAVLMVAYFFVGLTFPLKIFDVIIRLTIITVITPFVAMAAQFPATKNILGVAVKNVLNAVLTLFFMSIAFAVMMAIMQQVLADIVPGVMNAGQAADTVDSEMTTGQFMTLLGLAVGMIGFTKMAVSMAGEFSGFNGQSGGIGAAASAVAGGAIGLAGYGLGAAGAGGLMLLGGMKGGMAAQASKKVLEAAGAGAATEAGRVLRPGEQQYQN